MWITVSEGFRIRQAENAEKFNGPRARSERLISPWRMVASIT
nr:hypothetical protein [Marinicella sp. W31]MDC2875514.1 hypothetical protein [Marinicella sp. W31]